QAQILATEKKLPNDVLVGLNRDNPALHDVYRLDLTTGDLVKEVENPGFAGWVADTHLVTRVGVGLEPDGSVVVRVRDGADGDWRLLLTLPAEDAMTSGPMAISPDGATMLAMSSLGADTGRLVRVDLGSGAEEVIAEDPDADVSDVRVHPDTREPQVVTWVKDRTEYRVLDPALEADVAAIRALHRGDPDIVAKTSGDWVCLVASTTARGRIPSFLYDRRPGEGRFLFDPRPELPQYELAPMEPFSSQARDGLPIHGSLTFPP